MPADKHNLLFVDDEEDIIAALYDTFAYDYNVFKTTNPKEALEIVKKEDIALIISDQRMPDMTGSELLAEIYDAKPETIRILLTGYADINAAVDAINKGSIHKYVEKPWNDEKLQDMVASLVKIYEESKEKLSILSDVQDVIKSESSFRTIMDHIKEGICAISEDGSVNFANMSALNILGYGSINEVASKNVFNISDTDLEEFRAEFKASRKVKGRIFTATAKDDSSVDILLTPILSQQDERMVGVVFQGI